MWARARLCGQLVLRGGCTRHPEGVRARALPGGQLAGRVRVPACACACGRACLRVPASVCMPARAEGGDGKGPP